MTTAAGNKEDSSAMSGSIEVNESKDLAIVTICNERRLNALTVSMWRDLRSYFQAFAKQDALRCILIRGAGDSAFSAGADISEFGTTRTTRDQVTEFHEQVVGGALTAMLDCPIPIVAEIRGSCFGGGLEIASACDLRLAERTAQFGAPVGRLGFPLAFAETQVLFNLVGPAVAAEILLEGRTLSAQDALERGLLTRIAEPQDLRREVDAAVDGVSRSGIWAARCHKRQLRRLMRDSSPVTLSERQDVYAFADTDEYHEGIRRFLSRKAR